MKRTRNVSVLLSTTMVQYMKTQQGQWRRRDASLSFFHFRMRRARCCVYACSRLHQRSHESLGRP